MSEFPPVINFQFPPVINFPEENALYLNDSSMMLSCDKDKIKEVGDPIEIPICPQCGESKSLIIKELSCSFKCFACEGKTCKCKSADGFHFLRDGNLYIWNGGDAFGPIEESYNIIKVDFCPFCGICYL